MESVKSKGQYRGRKSLLLDRGNYMFWMVILIFAVVSLSSILRGTASFFVTFLFGLFLSIFVLIVFAFMHKKSDGK